MPANHRSDNGLVRRWLVPQMVRVMAGGKVGAENYVPTNQRECEEMAWRQQTQLMEETRLDIHDPFWVEWFKKNERQRGELTPIEGVFYYTPQLLGMIDTLVQEVGRDMITESTLSHVKIEEATRWWRKAGRMDAFDAAMLDMWKFELPFVQASPM
jgi:hypothetical protein